MKTKNIFMSMALILVLVINMVGNIDLYASQEIGSGTIADPYKIYTVGQLIGIDQNLSAHYELAADIDLSGINWQPIGTTGDFKGGFDGNGHTISNLRITMKTYNNLGLFAKTSGATIKNVKLKNVNITGSAYVGGLVGSAYNGTIDNCTIDGTVSINGSSNAGGLIGYAYGYNHPSNPANSTYCTITDCSMEGTISISGGSNTGGLIGTAGVNVNITNCSLTGEISVNGGTGTSVGGLIGYAYGTNSTNKNTISNCAIAGKTTVNGSSSAGGLVGYASYANLADCVISGELMVKGSSNIGGLIGSTINGGNITNCSVDATGLVLGSTNIGGLIGSVNAGGTVENSHSRIDVEATVDTCGGLIGFSQSGNVTNCYATGNVVSDGGRAGGLIGSYYAQNTTPTTISSCYATGNVTSNRISSLYVGGLIGYGYTNDSTNAITYQTTIENCFAMGDVTGNSYCGGLIGYWEKIVVNKGVAVVKLDLKNCYVASKVEGNLNLASFMPQNTKVSVAATYCYFNNDISKITPVYYATGRATSDMVRKAVFTGWNFTDVWTIEEGATYPYLSQLDRPVKAAIKSITWEGSGTKDDPYRVKTKEDLGNIQYNPSAYYAQAKDIDFDYGTLTPIGTTQLPFSGSFDGCGYTISNATINAAGDYKGLFGYALNADIKNVKLENVNVANGNNIGSLIGCISNGSVTNCSVSGMGRVNGGSYVGGLIGYANAVTITDCYSTVTVSGSGSSVGGLIGQCNNTTVTSCYAMGTVSGATSTGGLIGFSYGSAASPAIITTSFANCTVTGTGSSSAYTGGLIGYGYGLNITDCFAVGIVSTTNGGNYNSGLIGYAYSSAPNTITNCYSAVKLTNGSGYNAYKGGLYVSSATATSSYFDSDNAGITTPATQAKTTEELQTAETYVDWDFGDVWAINDGEYPYLKGRLNPLSSTLQAPINITVKSLEPTSIAVSWDSIYSAIGYDLSYDDILISSIKPSIIVDNLIPDTQYEFTIRSKSMTQTSDWSIPIIITTSSAGPASGTVDEPYLIYNAEQLFEVNNNLTSFYRLMRDIDLENISRTSIGTAASPFSGGLDGNGYTIKNLKIHTPDSDNVGLFGYTLNATIKDLKLDGVDITGKNNVGAIIGFMNGGLLDNCTAKRITQVKGEQNFGGLVGNIDGLPEITRCNFEGVTVGDVLTEKTLNLVNGNTYMITFTTSNISTTNETVYKITYDPTKLVLIDFAAQTNALDVKVGKVANTNLEIITHANGVITFKANKSPANNNNYSGILTVIKIKSLATGNAVIKFEQ